MAELWDRCLEKIREEVSPQTFERWFSNTTAPEHSGGILTVRVPDAFTAEMLRTRYGGILDEILRQESGGELRARLVASGVPASSPAPQPFPGIAARPQPSASPPKKPEFLNSKYQFSSFVVGSSNQFAHACSLRAAEQPGESLNPLFIYGGVGLGKTHLLHGIAHRILEKNPMARIYYTSAENFINELIGSLQRNTMAGFRNKYRKIDALLVDDIQFIAGKERTQEEFFFTFNALYESGKQIVITSDRVPKDTPGLEERLRTRFVWGMMADVGVPDFETKVAILQKKATEHNFPLVPEVAHYVAENIRSNIRELEGCLVKLIFHSSLHEVDIDVPIAQEVLKQIILEPAKAISVDTIQRVVAEHYQIKVSDLRSKNRSQIFAFPRQVAMYLSRELTRASTTEIGRRFGGKDHSTVIHSTNKIKNLLSQDHAFSTALGRIRETIESL
ncbi:MAG: chromosomal replication initiator protein DnaA [bacterium]|nr:chromosomal replication initiator protein DnaA [bacterium]